MPKILLKLALSSLLIISYSLLIPNPAVAQQDFDTRFTSSYTISTEGITTVTHHIELTNRLAHVYATQYSLTIGSTRIKDIKTTSPHTRVNTQLQTSQNTSNILLDFSDPVIGKQKTLRFSISYINLDIATKSGRVLEVNIPRLKNIDNIDSYNLVVKVPDTFDAPTIMSPGATTILKSGNQQILRYQKDQLTDHGISILFGNHQVYDFSLRYSLHNPAISPGKLSIAIPPDTAYQKMYYHQIDPQPENITLDEDGNWLAHYTLKPRQTLLVTTNGQAAIYLKPTVAVPKIDPSTDYLIPQKYWPATDSDIKALAKELKTPERIYNYVVSNLTYNYQRVETGISRLGAKSALKNPQNALCTEFTDLFITLARAAGIPARAHDGFAFTANSKLRPLSLRLDILHTWPEYYDTTTQAWVPVDPTWGNTTGGINYFSRWDLNHFSFVLHGLDSDKPYPAGAYKLKNTQGKDVQVAFSTQEPAPTYSVAVDFKPAYNLFSSNPKIITHFTNLGNTAITPLAFSLSAPGYNISKGNHQSLPTLLPFATTQSEINLTPNLISQNILLTLTIDNTHSSYTYEATQSQNYSTLIALALIAFILASATFFIAKRTRRLSLQNPKK